MTRTKATPSAARIRTAELLAGIGGLRMAADRLCVLAAYCGLRRVAAKDLDQPVSSGRLASLDSWLGELLS